MTSLRFPLLAAMILAGFVWAAVAVAQAPVEWYTDTGGGGTLAQPVGQSKNGGALAPVGAGAVGDPPADADPKPPTATPAQASPSPSPRRERRSAAAGDRPTAQPAQAAPTVTGGEDQESSGAGLIGSLPLTGLELAALAGAGLFLVLAGAALRPRRRTAEPR
jgi:hypothetical protein